MKLYFYSDSEFACILTAQRYASAVYAVVMCLSVCVCVGLSHSAIVSKRLNTGSRKQRHTIAQGQEIRTELYY